MQYTCRRTGSMWVVGEIRRRVRVAPTSLLIRHSLQEMDSATPSFSVSPVAWAFKETSENLPWAREFDASIQRARSALCSKPSNAPDPNDFEALAKGGKTALQSSIS